MADFRLLENAFAGSSEVDLFQRPAFFRMHDAGQAVFFEWQERGKVVASVHFTPVGNASWRSPARGTFAGFVWTPDLHSEYLFAFHDAVLARLRELGARRVEVLPAPMAHDEVAFANQTHMLYARGYQVTQCDVNHSLVIDDRRLVERMSYGNQKRLRRCEREGLIAQRLSPDLLPQVYATLAANREGKGHRMSMSLADLQALQEQLPEVMLLFGCAAGTELAAAALCLLINPHVLYVFYWGDRPGYTTMSPVVSVAEAIHAHCQSAGVRILDVGTSSVDRTPNFGLIQFKRGLGFAESLKLRMARDV